MVTRTHDESAAPALLGAFGALLGTPLVAALMALIWKYPLLMVGNEGGDLGAAYVAALTVVFYLTLASMGLGFVVVGAVGGGLGWAVRRRGKAWAFGAGAAFGAVLAVVAGVIVMQIS